MKKNFKHFKTILLSGLLALLVSSSISSPVFASPANPQEPCKYVLGEVVNAPCIGNAPLKDAGQQVTTNGMNDSSFWASTFLKILADLINNIVLRFTALITGLAGGLLNGVVFYTVVKMKENYDQLKPILTAWQTLRNIANMSFIFVLLYAGIRTILGQEDNNKQVIVNVIVAAVLLNFSMFITRVVIDMSNIFSLVFYDAIAPGSLMKDGSFNWSGGLSSQFARALGIQSFYGSVASGTNFASIVMTALMGSIMLLVAAFTFTAAAIMFLIRYVVLLLVIVLSPIYFVALALPKGTGMKKYQDQWKDALFGQAFFAPIYFFFIWLSLRILTGVMGALGSGGKGLNAAALPNVVNGDTAGGNLSSAILMLMNYGIVIILLITALIQAKEWADKAGGGMKKLTSWATGKAGSATFGVAGFATRQTIGRGAAWLGENERLKERAAQGGFFARQTLQASRGVGASSFDFRTTGIGGQLGAGKAGGQKGFIEARKKKTEAEAKFAGTLGASDRAVAKAEQRREEARNINVDDVRFQKEYEKAKKAHDQNLEEKRQAFSEAQRLHQEYSMQIRPGNPEDEARLAYLKGQIDKRQDEYDLVQEQSFEDIQDYRATRIEAAEAEVDKLKGINEEEAKKRLREAGIDKPTKPQIEAVKQKSSGEANKSKFATSVERSKWAKFRGYNYTAAAAIRKGKSDKDKLVEAAKALSKADTEAGDEESGAAKETKPTSVGEGGSEPKPTA